MKDNLNMKNVVTRFKSETPDFFKQVKKISLTLGSVAVTVLAVGTTITLPPVVMTTAAIILALTGGSATTAQLTKK